jgi:hypothetical protein
VHADADYDADSDADECEVDECEAVALMQWHPVKSMPKLLRLLRCRHWLLPWQPEPQQSNHCNEQVILVVKIQTLKLRRVLPH